MYAAVPMITPAIVAPRDNVGDCVRWGKVTTEGVVKLLDFGLAKAVDEQNSRVQRPETNTRC